MVCGPNQGSVPNNRLHQINPGVCSCFLLFLINYHPTTTPQHQHHSTNTTTPPQHQHHNSTNTTTAPTPQHLHHIAVSISAVASLHSLLLLTLLPSFIPQSALSSYVRHAAGHTFYYRNTPFHLKITQKFKVTQKAALNISHISQQPRPGTLLLSRFPALRKCLKCCWLNACIACHITGFRLEMR